MKLIQLIFLISALLFAGCASVSPQTLAYFKETPKVKASAQIEVPFINQEAGQCGPASLTMALQAAGKTITVNEILPQVFTSEKNGTLQTDMISATRRNGMMAIPIAGLSSLISEVEAGHPVVIFENLGINWLPQWHYAIVTGYNIEKQSLTMHSGPKANEQINMREFELSWKLTNYWGLLVLNPNQLSVTASELTHLQAASSLEQIGKLSEAQTAYQTILIRWPQSMTAYIGLGNIFYKTRDYKSAVSYLKKAEKLFPSSEVVKHNLAVAEKAL